MANVELKLRPELYSYRIKYNKAVITVPGCSMGSGMKFVELRGTRILTEGDSRFYTQPEVGRWGGWLLPSVPVWLLPMYQYSFVT
jgi:hypothetical protein